MNDEVKKEQILEKLLQQVSLWQSNEKHTDIELQAIIRFVRDCDTLNCIEAYVESVSKETEINVRHELLAIFEKVLEETCKRVRAEAQTALVFTKEIGLRDKNGICIKDGDWLLVKRSKKEYAVCKVWYAAPEYMLANYTSGKLQGSYQMSDWGHGVTVYDFEIIESMEAGLTKLRALAGE